MTHIVKGKNYCDDDLVIPNPAEATFPDGRGIEILEWIVDEKPDDCVIINIQGILCMGEVIPKIPQEYFDNIRKYIEHDHFATDDTINEVTSSLNFIESFLRNSYAKNATLRQKIKSMMEGE